MMDGLLFKGATLRLYAKFSRDQEEAGRLRFIIPNDVSKSTFVLMIPFPHILDNNHDNRTF